jgi:hypothetical protein
MKSSNKNPKQPDNMELLKQQASACGSECGCHATGTQSKTRRIIGALVLVAAMAMVARAVVKSNAAPPQTSEQAFALPIAATNSGAVAQAPETAVGITIGAFSELNAVAIKTDAVFIFLPGKGGVSGNPPSTTMKEAARTIEAQGKKIGLFTLKPGSPDYDQIAKQMSVPGVLTIVKGRGMSAVSGDITEAKLVQGFVAASSAGGCGPSAGAGCCPKK